ncbi:MAG: hypothetical protein V1857_06355 [archaeon]
MADLSNLLYEDRSAIAVMGSKCSSGAKLCAILVLSTLLLIQITAAAPDEDLSLGWIWNDGVGLPVGTRSSTVGLKLVNQGKQQIRLEFVGVRFDWMEKDVYAYGGGSEKTNLVSPGQSVTYTIPFGIPENLKSGTYKCLAGIVYYVQQDGAWRRVEIAQFSTQDLQIVPVAVVTVTSTTTVQANTEDWAVDFALLIAFTAVGLALLATFRSARRKQAA